MVRKYNISKPKKYIKGGVEKTFWQNVGTMTEFDKQDGSVSRIIEIPAIGLEANIFPVNTEGQQASKPKVTDEHEEQEINIDDIPF